MKGLKKIFKPLLSAFMCCVLIVGIITMSGEEGFAQIKDTVISSFVGIANTLSDLDPDCNHVYADPVYPSKACLSSSGTSFQKAYITYTCKKCGGSKSAYEFVGHRYRITGVDYRTVHYKCTNPLCKVASNNNQPAETTKSVEYLLQNYTTKNINSYPIGSGKDDANAVCFLDVVPDGFVNAKDYAYIQKLNEPRLVNPNADETAKRVYKYICEIDGNYTLSAQQESTWMGSPDYEMNYIYNNTGKYPAMRGLDYMNDDFYGVNQRAIAWWNRGGLVTICWHTGSDFTGEWNDAMNDTVSSWNNMLTEGTSEYNQMIAGMDKAARALKELQNAGVTVLWRPFHEFDGAWFWWGKGGASRFKTLWKIMYDRYTNYWHLDNLIWVLGFSHVDTTKSQWYPGDEYCDIIGVDTYDTSEFSRLYNTGKSIASSYKPFCLHECGKNPTAGQLGTYKWCYFMTWHTNYITDDNTTAALNSLYNSSRVITLDEVDF